LKTKSSVKPDVLKETKPPFFSTQNTMLTYGLMFVAVFGTTKYVAKYIFG